MGMGVGGYPTFLILPDLSEISLHRLGKQSCNRGQGSSGPAEPDWAGLLVAWVA